MSEQWYWTNCKDSIKPVSARLHRQVFTGIGIVSIGDMSTPTPTPCPQFLNLARGCWGLLCYAKNVSTLCQVTNYVKICTITAWMPLWWRWSGNIFCVKDWKWWSRKGSIHSDGKWIIHSYDLSIQSVQLCKLFSLGSLKTSCHHGSLSSPYHIQWYTVFHQLINAPVCSF